MFTLMLLSHRDLYSRHDPETVNGVKVFGHRIVQKEQQAGDEVTVYSCYSISDNRTCIAEGSTTLNGPK